MVAGPDGAKPTQFYGGEQGAGCAQPSRIRSPPPVKLAPPMLFYPDVGNIGVRARLRAQQLCRLSELVVLRF